MNKRYSFKPRRKNPEHIKIAPMSSASKLLANASLIIPERKKNWAFRKNLPAQVALNKREEERKRKISEIVAASRASASNKHCTYLVAKRVKGRYQALGFGKLTHNGTRTTPKTFKTLKQVRIFAGQQGRNRVKCGIIDCPSL